MLYYTYTSSPSPSHFLGSPLSLTSLFFIQVQLVLNGHHQSCGRSIVVLAIVVGVVP